MSTLWALFTATDAAAGWQLLTRLARSLGPQDPRGLDERRADLLVDLITGRLTVTQEPDPLDPDLDAGAGQENAAGAEAGESAATGAVAEHVAGSRTGSDSGAGSPAAAPAGGSPLVHIVVGLGTLAGSHDVPAELVGYGPIPTDLARAAAAHAVWKRLVTDPLSGALLDHGRSTYRPPAALHDYIVARDVTCRFPTCNRRAIDADLDHLHRWSDGGSTDQANLHGLCGPHHLIKEQDGWQVIARLDGTLSWITPTGHRYVSRPRDYRDYLPERDLDPGVGGVDPPPPEAVESRPPAPVPDEPPF